MPANAYRLAHLRQHTTGTWSVPWPDLDRDRVLRLHPDWSLCAAGCGWPVDPAAGTTHPMCEGTLQ